MAGKTEWEDALIKHGIMEAPEVLPTEDELQLQHQEEMAAIDPLEDKDLSELDELEDDFDERILQEYRNKRLEELKAKAATDKFGEFRQISETDYALEVTEASKKSTVVVHLFQSGKLECNILNQIFASLAQKFRHIKFLKIVAAEAIHNYPDGACPTILIYSKGDLFKQLVGLSVFNGMQTNIHAVEWVFAGLGILETDLEEDPRLKLAPLNVNRQEKRSLLDDDDDW